MINKRLFKIEKDVNEFIEKNNLIKENEKIIIGISGGPDSVFLFHVLNKINTKYKLKMYFAHINHLLRGESSDADEKFVYELGKKYEVETFILREDIKKYSEINKMSIEEAAREVRYSYFENLKKELNADKVVLAHNLDDNVETFLFRLMRGTALKGLKSIPVRRDYFIRPVINISKSDILYYLQGSGYEYRIDESNDETIYTRNKIRHELIPYIEKNFNPEFKYKVVNLIREINLIEKNEKEYDNFIEDNKIKISILLEHDIYTAKKIINNFLIKNKVEQNYKKTESIIEILEKGGTLEVDLGNRLVLVKDYTYIYIKSKSEKREEILEKQILYIEKEIFFGKTKITSEYIDKIYNVGKNEFLVDEDKLKDKKKLYVRGRKDGDSIVQENSNLRRKLKKIFIDMKIEKDKRDRIPIITDEDDNIIWIAGIKGSEIFKAKENSKKIIKLTIKEV